MRIKDTFYINTPPGGFVTWSWQITTTDRPYDADAPTHPAMREAADGTTMHVWEPTLHLAPDRARESARWYLEQTAFIQNTGEIIEG